MTGKKTIEIEPYWPNVERFLQCLVDDDRTEPEAREQARAALAEVTAYLDFDPERRKASMHEEVVKW
tara:strand:+ start:318 stop:518 length:201 start_codon:yes stop_codon:yes gene_type:complete